MPVCTTPVPVENGQRKVVVLRGSKVPSYPGCPRHKPQPRPMLAHVSQLADDNLQRVRDPITARQTNRTNKAQPHQSRRSRCDSRGAWLIETTIDGSAQLRPIWPPSSTPCHAVLAECSCTSAGRYESRNNKRKVRSRHLDRLSHARQPRVVESFFPSTWPSELLALLSS
jgi:hypothetical protein